MKTATFPSLRVEQELQEAAEQSLHEGETLSSFVEQSIRESIERRRYQREFLARGLASREDAKRTGNSVSSEAVLRLEGMLAAAKSAAVRPGRIPHFYAS
ncbi:prevent-host-death protein [Massilia sp. NR 4-1]|nr:YlcI/YnfO family protein [Massilia sp. NR 4-1]AKU25027.1 prevent-host-death protein [Massilia sp. NR 4-1]